MKVLEEFGFGGIGLKDQDFLEPNSIVQLGYPPNRIDLVTGIEGVNFDEAWASRVEIVEDGVSIHYISRELLLQNKRASHRPKDLVDVAELEKKKP
jgi:hypothetical protein